MKSRVKAYAKVNLFLDITGRLENGYHTLNTVMQQVDIYDIVTVETVQSGNITITCTNPAVPCNEKNIAYKAADAFLSKIGKVCGVSIGIEKNIPLEAGMGGSSTDGAAVLIALNESFGKPFTTEQLCEIGAGLGADVPFCILGGTAVCKGIGEIMTPVLCKKDYVLGIVKPEFSCSTPAAYKAYDENPLPIMKNFDSFVSELSAGCENWGGEMYNVFEQLYSNPKIDAITRIMRENGAVGSILTGSGSAVFGVFRDKKTAENALNRLDIPFKIIANPI